MAVLNGWINGFYESDEAKAILKELNIENGIVSNKVFMNGEIGYQFYINHNHAGYSFDFFFEKLKQLVALESKELHGIIYYHNDEDAVFHDQWQVWIIRQGIIEVKTDSYLSPFSEKVAIYEDDCPS